MTIKVTDLTVFNDLSERLGRLSEPQIEWGRRRIKDEPKDDDKIIGTVTSESTIALYILGLLLNEEARLEDAKARVALDEIAEAEHKQQHALLDMLGDVARELFWVQAKIDLGFYECKSVGLRKGFVLIECVQHASGLAGLLPKGLFPA